MSGRAEYVCAWAGKMISSTQQMQNEDVVQCSSELEIM